MGISSLCILGFIKYSGLDQWLLEFIIDNPSDFEIWSFTGLILLPFILMSKGMIEYGVDNIFDYAKLPMGPESDDCSGPGVQYIADN